uniref:Uncharacterized protein n=1 Tax=Arundo donax TaxID=35708 RepID=A0A0A9EYH1_ARUDO
MYGCTDDVDSAVDL